MKSILLVFLLLTIFVPGQSEVIEFVNNDNYSGAQDISVYNKDKDVISYLNYGGTTTATADASYIVCGVFGC